MNLTDFHYELPSGRIAQEPVSPRDHARLLVVPHEGARCNHRRFHELPSLLRAGDLLVINTTRVFPARLRGRKPTGGKVEVLLLNPDSVDVKALVRGVMQPTRIVFPEGVEATMQERLPEGEWRLQFAGGLNRAYLERHAEMPLPPYIKRASPQASDRDRYQTVYANQDGAVAAPTAGFHFTPELLERLSVMGVQRCEVVLHVGWGTFQPVRAERIEDHAMLAERYEISTQAAEAIGRARAEGRRVVAVGTTCVRALESAADEKGHVRAGQGQTRLFIYPGYRFKAIDALITNFHLPDSTPLLLACAFYTHKAAIPTSVFSLRKAYEEAIREGYRFYSYGDAMLIQ